MTVYRKKKKKNPSSYPSAWKSFKQDPRKKYPIYYHLREHLMGERPLQNLPIIHSKKSMHVDKSMQAGGPSLIHGINEYNVKKSY